MDDARSSLVRDKLDILEEFGISAEYICLDMHIVQSVSKMVDEIYNLRKKRKPIRDQKHSHRFERAKVDDVEFLYCPCGSCEFMEGESQDNKTKVYDHMRKPGAVYELIGPVFKPL